MKICPDITAAWPKLNLEFSHVDVVTLSMVEVLAKLSFKSANDHKDFQELYDAWRHCEADLKDI